MNTPKQLTKYREEFAKAEHITFNDAADLENTINRRFPRTFDGYCLAKQETEQIMKLAKFGAMVLRTYEHNGDITEAQVNAAAKDSECMHDAKAFTVLAPNIEATIKELLK